MQWENSAVKGDTADAAMASSLTVFDVDAARLVGATRHWQERGVWRQDRTSDASWTRTSEHEA